MEKAIKEGFEEQQDKATRNGKHIIETKLTKGCLKRMEHRSDLWDLTKACKSIV